MTGHGSRIARNAGTLFFGEIGNKVLRFVATLAIAHTLSVADFGLVNVAIAVSGILLVGSSLGLPDQGARDVAIGTDQAGWLVGRILVVRMLVIAVAAAITLTAVLLIAPGSLPILALAAVMAFIMASSGDWLARGLEKISLLSLANVVGGAAMLAGALILTRWPAGPVATMGVFALAEAATSITLWIAVHRFLRVRIGLGGVRPLLSRARPLAFSSIAIYSYYANIDTVILALSHSTVAAGQYTAAYRLFLVFNLVPVFAAYAMLPTLARLTDMTKAADANHLLESALPILVAYGLLALTGVELFGGRILAALFGHPYLAAAPTFILLTLGVTWYSVGYPVGYSLIAINANSRFLRGAATASIANIVLDVTLIPSFGMPGAGIATFVALLAASFVWLKSRSMLTHRQLPMLLALAVATILGLVAIIAGSIFLTIAALVNVTLASFFVRPYLSRRRRARRQDVESPAESTLHL